LLSSPIGLACERLVTRQGDPDMANTSRMLVAACALAAAVACGGGDGGSAALSRTFNYGAQQAPTAGEQAAANSAQSSVSDTASFAASPSATKASSVVSMAASLVGLLGGVGVPAGIQDPNLRHALRSAASLADCTTVTPTTVTFKNCTETESGITFTLNGTVAASAGSVDWNVIGVFAGTEDGVAFNIRLGERGSFKVTSTTVVGHAAFDLSGTVSEQGQTFSFGLSNAAIVNLTYTPTCVTSGTLEVKQVWTQRPSGVNASQLRDIGVKLTWTRCGAVQVAHSQ
jgi:hypothetical protein